ncbi:MAG: hypothetical protein HYZ57_19460 [Acidobacteria bacterium]|nr:hypothetical protein [Acidobacteriota bacterium]
MALEDGGVAFSLEHFGTEFAAIEALGARELIPDLVVMSYRLAMMLAPEVLGHLRKIMDLQRVGVLVLGEPYDKQYVPLGSGATFFLSKPVDPDRIATVIRLLAPAGEALPMPLESASSPEPAEKKHA